jgi:hypothetical protein
MVGLGVALQAAAERAAAGEEAVVPFACQLPGRWVVEEAGLDLAVEPVLEVAFETCSPPSA